MMQCRLYAVALLLFGFSVPSFAESWPTKPIRMIVPFSPGSAADIIPRTVFAQVERQLGQPIIVENRPGGGTTIGIGAVARADPDGYTLLAASSAFTTAPLPVATLFYAPVRGL